MAAAVMAATEKLEEGLQHEILRLLRNRRLYPTPALAITPAS